MTCDVALPRTPSLSSTFPIESPGSPLVVCAPLGRPPAVLVRRRVVGLCPVLFRVRCLARFPPCPCRPPPPGLFGVRPATPRGARPAAGTQPVDRESPRRSPI